MNLFARIEQKINKQYRRQEKLDMIKGRLLTQNVVAECRRRGWDDNRINVLLTSDKTLDGIARDIQSVDDWNGDGKINNAGRLGLLIARLIRG